MSGLIGFCRDEEHEEAKVIEKAVERTDLNRDLVEVMNSLFKILHSYQENLNSIKIEVGTDGTCTTKLNYGTERRK